jgi:basic membrane lipoprotein Med (substrate-binding protein (PBP1-ABC) superfamily)
MSSASAVLDGTWEQKRTWAGMAEGHVVMAPYTNMPDDVKAMAEETEAKITSGEFHPFTGPIMKQDGSEWLADGSCCRRRRTRRPELLRQGHRRPVAAVIWLRQTHD